MMNDMKKVHISYNNSKLGKLIPSVNLPAVVTCRENAPCRNGCYACKGRFCFRNVKTPIERNLEVWETDPYEFEEEVKNAAFGHYFFRWHSSGDIVNEAYFEMMVRVAEALPLVSFLAFTKKFEIVNAWMDKHGDLPKNLSIVFSAWGDWIPDNPHNLPMAWVRFKKRETFIPENAETCPGYCGDCVRTTACCWHLKKGQHVVFNEH